MLVNVYRTYSSGEFNQHKATTSQICKSWSLHCFPNYAVWIRGWDCCAINHQQHSSLTSFHDSVSYVTFLFSEWRIETIFSLYAIPKIKMWCNLHCLKARLRLLCNKYHWHSSLNLVSGQLKLCNIFIFGMAYLFSCLMWKGKKLKKMPFTVFHYLL